MRFLLLALATATLWGQDKRIQNLAPFTATPYPVVERMLELGGLHAGEKMFDLGSGDGRIVMLAASRYKAESTGVEFDPVLVKQSIARIKSLNLTPLARIIEGDLLKQDYSSADLLTIYLLPIANEKLLPIFEKQLKPGTRIVSHNTPLAPWVPVKVEVIENDGHGSSHRLYLYKR